MVSHGFSGLISRVQKEIILEEMRCDGLLWISENPGREIRPVHALPKCVWRPILAMAEA